jgi:hypothetical protein
LVVARFVTVLNIGHAASLSALPAVSYQSVSQQHQTTNLLWVRQRVIHRPAMSVTCQQAGVSQRGDMGRNCRLSQPKVSNQISDAVFTTEQVLDDDEPVRVAETFKDGR